MFILIALVLLAVVALVIASLAVHILFSPLLLLLVAGILLWLTFRRRRYHR